MIRSLCITILILAGAANAQVSAPPPLLDIPLQKAAAINERSVVVLNRALPRGEIITAADLDEIMLPGETVRSQMAVSPDEIVGLQTRRPLRANQPIFKADLQRPILIKKGTMVTMVFTTPYMNLTAQGRAISDAAAGEIVRVVNLRSNQTVEGIANSYNRVLMASPQDFVMGDSTHVVR